MQLSEVIFRTRQYFTQVTGESGPMMFSDINTDVFEKRFREENIQTDNPAIRDWLDNMTYDTKGLIHLFSWSGLIDTNILLSDLFRVPNLNSGQMEPIISALTQEEEEMFKNMMRRFHTIFQVCTGETRGHFNSFALHSSLFFSRVITLTLPYFTIVLISLNKSFYTACIPS